MYTPFMPTRRPGRPSKLEASLAEEIYSRIAGGESLRAVCREPAMPARETVLRWVLRNAAFRNQYEDALRLRAEGYGEEIVELADEAGRQTDAVGVQAARLRVDTRKWVASAPAAQEVRRPGQPERRGAGRQPADLRRPGGARSGRRAAAIGGAGAPKSGAV